MTTDFPINCGRLAGASPLKNGAKTKHLSFIASP
jgi:hypothetical protein